MKYNYQTGLQKQKLHLKKIAIAAVASFGLATGAALPAMAAGSGDGSNASPCGAVHGAYADINGNFGFLGQEGGTPGYHDGAVGQEPGATGYNNSHANCQ